MSNQQSETHKAALEFLATQYGQIGEARNAEEIRKGFLSDHEKIAIRAISAALNHRHSGSDGEAVRIDLGEHGLLVNATILGNATIHASRQDQIQNVSMTSRAASLVRIAGPLTSQE